MLAMFELLESMPPVDSSDGGVFRSVGKRSGDNFKARRFFNY